jgi:hypothetical protein
MKILKPVKTLRRRKKLKMDELLERLYTELRCYGPNDKFNKGFYLTLTERVMKELGAADNQYVKLPVYIGKPVWVAHVWYNNITKEIDSGVVEGKVSMLQQKADKSWKFRVTTKYVSDYDLDDVGTYIFFTKEEAENAINEKIKALEEKYDIQR